MTEIEKYKSGGLIHSLGDAERAAQAMAASGYFQDARQAAQAIVKVLAGHEMGFGPFSSMNGIYIIQGRPAISANLMAAAVKRSGRYDYRVTEMSDTRCAITFYENGKPVGESPFTIEDARKAGTKNLDKFPRNMLFSRAISNGVRWYCPDVFMSGPVYTPEELGAVVDDDGFVDMPAVIVEKPQPPAPEPPDDLMPGLDDDLKHVEERAAVTIELPGDCPTKVWGDFVKYAAAHIPGYENTTHVYRTIVAEMSDGDESWKPVKGMYLNGDPAAFWKVLVEHKHASTEAQA